MTKKRILYLILIIVGLISICITEQVMVNNYLEDTKNIVIEITEMINAEDVKLDNELYEKILYLEKTWKSHEENLCFLVNHNEIKDVGIEITKMKVSVVENNLTELKTNLAEALYYLDGYYHVMGISIQSLL